MASLAFNALSVSPKPVALLPTRYKSQNYALTVQVLPLSSNTRFRLNAVPRAHEVLSPKGRGFRTLWCTSASYDGDAVIESSAEQQQTELVSAIPVVMEFYEAINKKDVKAFSDILSDKCLMHDWSFPKAFEGKEAVLQYTTDLMAALGNGMLFKIDGISEGNDLRVAVLWHLEWQGLMFPFSKGCGIFYCEKQGHRLLIRRVHDFIESPLKPGELILVQLILFNRNNDNNDNNDDNKNNNINNIFINISMSNTSSTTTTSSTTSTSTSTTTTDDANNDDDDGSMANDKQ